MPRNGESFPDSHAGCPLSMPPDVQKRRLEGRKGNVSAFQIISWDEYEAFYITYLLHLCRVSHRITSIVLLWYTSM